jgi:DNA modification methylase
VVGQNSSLLEENKINLVFTDPPYGVYQGNWGRSLRETSKGVPVYADIKESEYFPFTKSWLSNIPLTDFNSIYVWINPRMTKEVLNALSELNFIIHTILVWVKNAQIISNLDYQPQHEFCCYGWKTHHQFYNKYSQSTVLQYDRPSKSPLHPTMKPIEMLVPLITNSSQPGELVYDPFGGSGSTLIECEQTSRVCYMLEIDPDTAKSSVNALKRMWGNKG